MKYDLAPLPDGPEWWPVADVAHHYNISSDAVRYWIYRRLVHARAIKNSRGRGCRYIISRSSINAWIAITTPHSRQPVPDTPPHVPQEDSEDYAAQLRAIAIMYARWGAPWPVPWPAWVGPFPVVEDTQP